MKAILIQVGCYPEMITVDGSLSQLQELVGGNIEFVPMKHKAHAYVNEDGKNLGLTENRIATEVLQQFGYRTNDFIVGNMVILGEGKDGDEGDVPKPMLKILDMAKL